MSFTLFVVALAVLAAPIASQSTNCTGGQVYSSCGVPCPTTCENYLNPPICLTACASGCFCPEGKVIHNNQCVDPSECLDMNAPPTTVPSSPLTTTSSTPTCPSGKVFQTCGTACPRTCDNRQLGAIPCTSRCVTGCFCPDGLVEKGSVCVLPDDCPVTTTPPTPTSSTPTCPSGHVFQTCGTACPRTCDNYQQEFLPCTRQCVIGCFCPEGLVEMGSMCVHPNECQVTSTPPQPATAVVSTPAQPVCNNGKIFQTCGSACPLSCYNHQRQPFACPAICAIGCFCPPGLVEYNDTCVLPTSCPDAATASPTTAPSIPLTTTSSIPTCPNGKVFQTCGTACPRTCDNHQQAFIPCTSRCVTGCFCPDGLVEMGSVCVPSEQCSVTSTPPQPATAVVSTPAQPVCSNGKLFQTCGPACPLSCYSHQSQPFACPAICAIGCFCPPGLVEYNDICLLPTNCPDATTASPMTAPSIPLTTTSSTPTCPSGKVFQTCGTACPRTCDNHEQEFIPCTSRCVTGCFCPDGLVEMGSVCVLPDQCSALPSTTVAPPVEPVCTNGKLFGTCGTACPLSCDNYRNPPTGCIDECFVGCFCPTGLVELNDGCVPPTSCPDKECPVGMEYRECGLLCPYTCDSYFGTNPCFSLRCAPAGCYCPDAHVMADGQCTPAEVACQDTRPTEVVIVPETSPVRLEMKIRNIALEEFMNHEGIFLTSVKNLLYNHGYGDVQASVHSITQDDHLMVVIQLSGDGISAAQVQELASLFGGQSSAFTLEVVEVTVSDTNASDSEALSSPAIIGIAVGASVVGLIVILLLLVILVMCIANRGRQTRSQDKYRKLTELDTAPTLQDEFTKNKLVKESLY